MAQLHRTCKVYAPPNLLMRVRVLTEELEVVVPLDVLAALTQVVSGEGEEVVEADDHHRRCAHLNLGTTNRSVTLK